MQDSLLFQVLVYLAAAIIAVPISKRVGLGSVLGYLIAGIAIGPWGLGLINNVETVLHFSEFGVVMMLFLIGLELNPKKLWQIRGPVFGLGSAQLLLTIAVITLTTMLIGWGWHTALVAAMGVAMSSTAIAVQTMQEQGKLNQSIGQAGFGVLLFQDIAVIPLMLILGLLASNHAGFDWRHILQAICLIAAVIFGGAFLLRPILRYIANTGLREIFIAFSLLLVIGVALLMQLAGLSMGLGAFLAGVLLADSEYRQELELEIDPFKGLLLGLFFIAVGMSVNLGLVIQQPLTIFGMALAFVLIKITLLFGIAKATKNNTDDALFFALVLSQIGEFAFVLFNTASHQQLLTQTIASQLNAVVAISMLTTPLLMLCYRAWAAKQGRTQPTKADEIEMQSNIIIGGYGRMGQIVARILNGIDRPPIVIERDPNQIELLRGFGQRSYYGDISRPDVLHAAGIANAQVLVLAIDDNEAILSTVQYVKKHYPHVTVLARARNRSGEYDLMDYEVTAVRETFFSALHLGELTLREIGFGAHHAHKIVTRFKQHDEALIKKTQPVRNDMKKLLPVVHAGRRDLADLLQAELAQNDTTDKGWAEKDS